MKNVDIIINEANSRVDTIFRAEKDDIIKISDLITKLEKIKNENGDLVVVTNNLDVVDEFCGYSLIEAEVYGNDVIEVKINNEILDKVLLLDCAFNREINNKGDYVYQKSIE